MKNLLLLFAAFITITPVFSQVSDSTQTPPDSVWQELPDQRTYFSKTFYNAHDETFRAEISAGYVHFQTRDGSFKEIDTRLQPASGNAYEMRDGLYQVRFAGAIGQQGGYDVDYELPKPVHAKLKDPGKPPASPTQLRWKILSLGYFDQKTQRYHVIQKSNPIAPVAADNAISYAQIFNGIDLNYTCGNTRLKEELVLSQSGRDALPDPSQFGVSRTDAYLMLETEFALTPASLEVFAKTSSGRVRIKQGNNFVFTGVDRIDFEDADSTLHFFFPEDVAYTLADSANRINVTRVFSSQRGKDYVLVGVPFSWIDAAPKGTLIIDPTVQPVANADVYLYDASNHNSAPDGLSLLVGKFAGTNKKRTVIKFPMTSIPANATVLNAQMKLRYFGNGGSTWLDRWVQAHRVLVDWNETQATRDARLTSPSYTAWKATYGKIGPGNNPSNEDADGQYESRVLFWQNETLPMWKSWDLTALTQKWVNGSASNYGVILWATNEDTDGKDLQFRSTSYTAGERPYLEVIYSQYAKTVYFLKDHLGSIRATVWDTANAPVVGYDDYDPWGFLLAGRSLANSVLPVATRNRFTGKERDDEFGVNWDYFGARYYDGQIGRWNGIDPLDQYSSPYVYVGNRPIVLVDPDGRFAEDFRNVWAWHFDRDGNLKADPGDNFETLLDFFKGDRALASLTWEQLNRAGLVNDDGSVSEGKGLDYATFSRVLQEWKALELAWLETDLAIGLLSGFSFNRQVATGFFGRLFAKIKGLFGKGNSFESVEELIAGAGKLYRVKGGQQGFVKGNVDEIFNQLTQNAKQLAPNRFQLNDGTIITKYSSSTTGVSTLQINKSGQIFKIRIE